MVHECCNQNKRYRTIGGRARYSYVHCRAQSSMKEETMKKHIALALLGTALASWPVLAQQSNAPAQQSTAPAQQQTSPKPTNQDRAMVLKQGEWRGSKLTGLTVHNNNDERVGDINELIVGKDGKIESIVLGVGGFIGLGEHDVAVPFGQVKFIEEPRRSDRTATRNLGHPKRRTSTLNMSFGSGLCGVMQQFELSVSIDRSDTE